MIRPVSLSLILLMSGSAAAFAQTGYFGTWEVSVREFGQKNYYLPMVDGRLTVEQREGRTVASYNQRALFTGQVEKDGLHLTCDDNGKPCGSFVLRLSGNQLTGSGTLQDLPVTIEGKRPAARPAPRIHEFNPQKFYTFFSGAIPPALRIFPGDSVKTHTLDSRGFDRDGKPRAPRGNPQTGPFYVEGAMPGDTLVVRLDRIRTNRDTAYQSNLISSNALEPGYLRELAKFESGFTQWKIDAAAGVATIINPTAALADYKVTLDPMLGGVGVAPPRDETFVSGRLGPYGGNLDTAQMRERVTVYLPVFQPGALLFIGDGHAQQGDGELPGQGLETSMDVQFTVDVIPGQAGGQTRVESADFMMIMGTGVTLDAAMKSATTEMSRWLATTYQLSPQEIAPLLGTAMQYEIAEVVDSEYNVVAKVRKDTLSQIRK